MFDTLRTALPHVMMESGESRDQATIHVPAESLVEICHLLHDREDLAFVLLADVTAVDWWPREPRYEVVYHLASHSRRLRLKVTVPGAEARVPTVQGVWEAAGWLEREVWDMFGIIFDGHGDLRRLLMPEDWEGHPLRKDHPVQVRLKPTAAQALQLSEDEFRANLAADRAARTPAPKGDA